MKCSDICAGDLRETVTIYREVRQSDGMGGYSVVYSPIAEIAAQVRPLSSREMIVTESLNSEITHKVFMRWTADLQPDDLLGWRDSVLVIDPPIDVEARQRYFEIAARLRPRMQYAIDDTIVMYNSEPVLFGGEVVRYA